MNKVITRNIGQNRGRPRVWLEGSILLDNGFDHGKQWTISYELLALSTGTVTAMVLSLYDATGKRKIAGSAKRPIIDIVGGAIEHAFDCELIKVLEVQIVERGVIRLIPAATTTEGQSND